MQAPDVSFQNMKRVSKRSQNLPGLAPCPFQCVPVDKLNSLCPAETGQLEGIHTLLNFTARTFVCASPLLHSGCSAFDVNSLLLKIFY